MDECVLTAENVTKGFDGFTLNDISFTIPKGSIVGLIGNNGAGKTTLIKCILDLVNMDAGKIGIFGIDNSEKESRTHVGTVFDENVFYEESTPENNAKVMSYLFKDWDWDLYGRLTKKYDIPPGKKIKTFSKGMKAKLQIAVALAHKPRLLIMDEPVAGLDLAAREEFYDSLSEFVGDDEKSVLISTHITDDLDKFADYILFLHNGNMVFFSEKDEVLNRYGIVRCTSEEYGVIDKENVLAHRIGNYGVSALVNDKAGYREAYPELLVEDAKLSEIMILTIRGD